MKWKLFQRVGKGTSGQEDVRVRKGKAEETGSERTHKERWSRDLPWGGMAAGSYSREARERDRVEQVDLPSTPAPHLTSCATLGTSCPSLVLHFPICKKEIVPVLPTSQSTR